MVTATRDNLKARFDALAQVQAQDAAQLETLTKPAACPYCGQPMPSKNG